MPHGFAWYKLYLCNQPRDLTHQIWFELDWWLQRRQIYACIHGRMHSCTFCHIISITCFSHLNSNLPLPMQDPVIIPYVTNQFMQMHEHFAMALAKLVLASWTIICQPVVKPHVTNQILKQNRLENKYIEIYLDERISQQSIKVAKILA